MRTIRLLLAIMFIIIFIAGCSDNEAKENTEPDITTVSSPTNEVSAIVLSTNSIEIKADEAFQLFYTVLPQNADNAKIVWSSANETVASVNEIGIITGINEGQTNIIAECENGVYEVCSVTVTGKSAYDSLSNKEKEFVDVFVANINVFYNPESVTIKYYYHGTFNTTGTWDITVSARNQMGGFSEKDYTIDRSGNITESILGHIQMPGWEDECDLDLINKAIKECIDNT